EDTTPREKRGGVSPAPPGGGADPHSPPLDELTPERPALPESAGRARDRRPRRMPSFPERFEEATTEIGADATCFRRNGRCGARRPARRLTNDAHQVATSEQPLAIVPPQCDPGHTRCTAHPPSANQSLEVEDEQDSFVLSRCARCLS